MKTKTTRLVWAAICFLLIGSDAQPQPTQPAAGLPRIGMPDSSGLVRIANRGFVRWGARWPTYVIPVCWEENSSRFAQERELVKRSINSTWEKHSGLRFVNWGECDPLSRGIRITVRDDGPRTTGLARELDGVPGGMLLNFTFRHWKLPCNTGREECIKSIAVHEFGHSIGFAHEQNRPDTPDGCPSPQGGNGDWLLTPWDPRSVMNYCNFDNRGVLSHGDIVSVEAMYPT